PGLKDVVQGSTCATSSRPRVSACSSFACLPDEPRKMRGFPMALDYRLTPLPASIAEAMLPAQLKEQITQAFADVERPGNYALRGSNEGEEPFLLEAEFADKGDWRSLEPAFLDQAPGGFASALSFFSDE